MSVRMHHDRKRYVVYCAQSYLAEGWIGTWLGSSPEHIDRLLVAPQTAKE
jgi:hypothetical protein